MVWWGVRTDEESSSPGELEAFPAVPEASQWTCRLR